MNIAKAKAMPIIPKIEALFNPRNDYAQFLLTIMLPCMWQDSSGGWYAKSY